MSVKRRAVDHGIGAVEKRLRTGSPPIIQGIDSILSFEEEEEEIPLPDPQEKERVTVRKPRLARYTGVFQRLSAIKKKEYKKRKSKWLVPRRHDYYKSTFSRGVESSGDKRIRALREALSQLDELGFRRSSHQREFHEAFIGACLPQIYGEDFDRNLVKILRENNLDEIRCEIMVCCPRRWGKTMAVALFAAAYMWTQPEAEIIIYSIAKRTSSMMSSKIYNMVTKLAGGDHCVVTHNQEDMVITNIHGNESVLHSYPAASRISGFPPSLLFPFSPFPLSGTTPVPLFPP
jgi:hypothetical protein